MPILKRLFSKPDRLFDLLEASAQEGRASVQALAKLLETLPPEGTLERILKSRDKEEQLNSEMERLLCQGCASALDRTDIEMLARALGRIPKGIKKFAERYTICAARLCGVSFARQARMLETATALVSQMIGDLKQTRHLSVVKGHNDALQQIENQADDLLAESLDGLWQWQHEPLKAVMLKDLHELLEKVFDRCRKAGNLVLQIELKRS